MKRVSYLVVWQIGLNTQSITSTPLDVYIDDGRSAAEKYEAILKEFEKQTFEENPTILSISRL